MNPDEKAAMVEKELLKTQFPLECEELPLESLTQEERIVVIKCMDHMALTDDEFVLLKATLEKYREYITKYRPTETVEAMENTIQIINTEQEFLDILNDESNKMLRVHLTYQGQVYEFNFEILPVDDSRIVDYMEMNIDLFKDYSNEEKQLFTKAQENKEELSSEEQAIVEKMTKEINAMAGQEKAKLIEKNPEIVLTNDARAVTKAIDIFRTICSEDYTYFKTVENHLFALQLEIANRLEKLEEDSSVNAIEEEPVEAN